MAEVKIPYETDLALFLIIIAAIVFCFLEIGLLWGVIILVLGGAFLLAWVHFRTKLFG